MLSVIMPLKNNLEYTKQAVNSLLSCTKESIELILVDDCSDDGTVQYIQQLSFDNKKIFLNSEPLMVTKSWNKGIRAATGEFLAIVNNDVVFTDGWDVPLIKALREGASLVSPYFTRGTLPSDFPSGAQRFHCNYVPRQKFLGACFMSYRSLYDKTGLFPEELVIWFNDTWLGITIEAFGGKIFEIEQSYVHHYSQKTINRLTNLKEITNKDHENFIKIDIVRKLERIEVISVWYNESFLAPFFLRHYDFADKINILLDADTNDNSLEILNKNPRVVIYPFSFPDRLDDRIKVDKINKLFSQMDCAWVITVDADEFVFTLPIGTELENYMSLRKHLKEVKEYNVIISQLWQVYRHNTERDLDSSREVITQRRFGTTKNIMSGQTMSYNKPIICKPSSHNGWEPGNHSIVNNENTKISPQMVNGAHWNMADTFVIRRRVQDRKLRQSKVNIEKRYGAQNDQITEEQVRAELDSHRNDPRLF